MRVVITGVGAVSPVGNTALLSFDALVRGKTGVAPLPDLDERFEVRIGAPVKGFDADALMGKKEARRHARFTHLCMQAAREAVNDAGLRAAGYTSDRIATVLGVGFGGLETIAEAAITLHEKGPNRVSPFAVPALIPNMAAGLVAIDAGAQGPSYCTASACASSAHALGEALALIRRGGADAVISGGAEAALTPLGLAGFGNMRALSKRNDAPERASRPFDKDRDGFVLGEGAGVLVLETLDNARKRGAHIYAELAGYGASADAFHVTQPDAEGRGAALAMRWALDDARVDPRDVGYINAHGTSTPYNDVTETIAIKKVFGEHARSLWVSSTKSMTGHLLGGAGGFEALATALTLQRGLVPPTVNLDAPDPQCDLDYVPHTARERRVKVAISNSFGFGGQNASLVLRVVE